MDRLIELLPALLVHTPRIVMGNARLWGDARGLHAGKLATNLLSVLHTKGSPDARAGTALTTIAAEAAATWGDDLKEMIAARVENGDAEKGTVPCLTNVTPGRDRVFIAEFPVDILSPPPQLGTLLEGIGVETCGQLAALDAAGVEVRLGADGAKLWKLACANDNRWPFQTPLRSLPSAALEWTDYVLRDAERLIFVANSLLASICAALSEQGERAREISLTFSLSNKSRHTLQLRSSRPTADQKRWLRLIRNAIDDLVLPDTATGMAIQVESVVGNDGTQGDLFDRGFANAHLVEVSLAELADDHGNLIVAPDTSQHPLADKRTKWVTEDPARIAFRTRLGTAPYLGTVATPAPGNSGAVPKYGAVPVLTLQLLEEPRPIKVTTTRRRDHNIPVRYRDKATWHDLVDVAGPDRVSGQQWDGEYNREYFRCVREDGMLVWLFRLKAAETPATTETKNAWYLHGWWD